MSGAAGKFRTTEWSPVVMKAAKVMYRRLRLADSDLPKWSKLSIDAVDHYCIAAQNCIEAFHYEASKDVEAWSDYR
jgi:hypothetical protein